MNAIVKVDFHGDTVTAARDGEQILVAVKPIIERLGLDWEAQRQRIMRDEVLESSACIIQVETPAGRRDTIALPLNLLPGFLFGISTGSIADPDIRAAAVAYKRECYDVLFRHFFGPKEGEAIDWDALAEKLNLVKQVRLTYGRKSAQELYERLGLPPVGGEAPPSTGDNGLLSYINDFLEECTERDKGTMAQATELYRLYLAWAGSNKSPHFTQSMFGRLMVQAGIRKRQSNSIYYIGLRIRHEVRQRLMVAR